MATDIEAKTTYATQNMKPAADEEIAALWGQNIGDNLGYLFFKKHPLVTFAVNVDSSNIAGGQGTLYFQKDINFNTLVGSVSGNSSNTTAFGTDLMYIDGTEVVNEPFASSQAVGTGISFDVSHLTDGQDYEVSYGIQSATEAIAFNISATIWGTTI